MVIPTLRKMLESEDASLRLGAVWVVGSFGSEAVPLLIERIDDVDQGVSITATSNLENSETKNAKSQILPLLKHKSALARYIAIQILTRDRNVIAEDIYPLLKDDDKQVRRRAFQSLGTMKSQGKQIQEVLIGIIKANEPASEERRCALESLIELGRPDGLLTMLEALKVETDIDLKTKGIHRLATFGLRGQLAIPFLLDALHDKSARVRVASVATLRRLGPIPKAAIPHLVEQLGDRDQDVRNSARDALGTLGNYRLVAFASGLATGNPTSRLEVMSLFENTNPLSYLLVPGLVECLKDSSTEVRLKACRLLMYVGRDAKEAVPALQALLSDADINMRYAARNAINAIEQK